MGILKYAAWITLAMLPLMLVKKRNKLLTRTGREVESEEIFDYDLWTD